MSEREPNEAEQPSTRVSPAESARLNPLVLQVIPWLYEAARDAARTALGGYARTDRRSQLQSAIAFGSAVEYLGRAVLANHDPVLLARRDSLPTVVMLSRANASGTLDSKVLRSIDAKTVWLLLEEIDPKIRLRAAAEVTATVRNAAVHMALVESSNLEEAAIALTTIVATLHPFLGSQEHEFWGVDLADIVQVLKDEKSNAIQRAVSALIAERRAQLDSLLGSLGSGERETLLIFLRARDVAFEPTERFQLVDQVCPACENDGVATYGIEEGDAEPSYREKSDGDWAEYSWQRDLYPFALAFNCPVCGLHLDDTQFAAAGLPTELDIQYEEAEDPSFGWEPDEDWEPEQ
jgi:hypothetical protein